MKRELVTLSLAQRTETKAKTAPFMIKVSEDISKKLQILHRHRAEALQ